MLSGERTMKFSAGDLEIEVRSGTVDDVPLLLSFMRSMAEFEKLEITATEESLMDSLFGERPAANTLLAFVAGKPAAYATYFFSFASMVGKRCLWLDDLFVKPDFRGKGLGKVLLAYVADVAVQNECARMEWMVLHWNRSAIDFYQNLGATVLEDWRICGFDEDQISLVAEQLVRLD
jgi:GNAT superfamily N-acetyltransferase